MKNTYDLKGKVALVTGASSGIGKAIALTFARSGATVVIADINESAGQDVVSEIEAMGQKSLYLSCDITSTEQVQSMVQTVVNSFGCLDIAVNNAGVGLPPELTADIDVEKFEWMVNLNLTGAFRCMKFELNQMVEQEQGGVIINMASALGLTTIEQNTPYVAAKHGVVGLTKNAAIEYAANKVRINAICPGIIETSIILNSPEEVRKGFSDIHPSKRLGQPEEVAALAAWLASDDASFVTGSMYSIDGGWTAN